jgi:hypothetical protein
MTSVTESVDSVNDVVQEVAEEISETAANLQKRMSFAKGGSSNEAKDQYDVDDIHKQTPVDLDLMLYSLERRNQKRKKCIELLIYIPFIVVVILWLTFSTYIEDAYYMNANMKHLFMEREFLAPGVEIHKNFKNDVNTPQEFFQWASYVLIPFLYPTTNYDGTPLRPQDSKYILSYNRVLGSMRWRQIRVSNTSCVRIPRYAPDNKPNWDPACYGEFGNGAQIDTTPFGPDNMFKYLDCEQSRGGLNYQGRRYTYPCGGHTTFFPFSWNQTQALAQVQSLQVRILFLKLTRCRKTHGLISKQEQYLLSFILITTT